MPRCFGPIINKQSQILILGTLPGTKSLEINEYYADPRNQFWQIIYAVYNEPVDSDYSDRCKFILAHKLALWDILDYGNREGALDAAISNETPNDFKEFFRDYPNIKLIILNGTKVRDYFKKYFKDYYKTILCITVPSTSPTPGRYVKTINEKKSKWKMTILEI